MSLAGQALPPAVLVEHAMVTRANVCQYYPEFPCASGVPEILYTFPQDAFLRHLASLKDNPELAGYETLIPAR